MRPFSRSTKKWKKRYAHKLEKLIQYSKEPLKKTKERTMNRKSPIMCDDLNTNQIEKSDYNTNRMLQQLDLNELHVRLGGAVPTY